MDIDTTKQNTGEGTDKTDPMDVEIVGQEPKKVPEKPEPEFELLDNPARVTRAQLKYITFDVDPRYVPISEGVHGVILLKDTKPGETEDIIKGGVPSLTQQDDENEPTSPDSFLFLG